MNRLLALHRDEFGPASDAPPAEETYLHGWFLRGLQRNPGGVALRVGTESRTYTELHRQALALAGELVEVTGGRPARVGVLAAHSILAYAGILAAGYAGAAAVPLNPDFPAERTQRMVAAAGLDAMVADEFGRVVLPALAAELGGVPVVVEPTAPPLPAPAVRAGGDIAYIMFTSGSTGRPKGVPVLNRNAEHYLRYVHDRYSFTTTDVFSQTADLTFDLSIFDLFGAWGCGGTVVSMPPKAFVAVPEFVRGHGITVWCSSPSVVSLLRRSRRLTPGSMPSLRVTAFCGEPLLRQDAADWQAAAVNCLVENLYGPTELTVSCSVHTWRGEASAALCVNDIVSIGRIHPGLDHVLVDGDGNVDPESGELCVTGPQMFPGYLDPGDDTGRFLDHDGRRWYRTGDIVRALPGGEMSFLGRRDHQVKIHGVRVELSEVESGMRRCRGVQDAVVIALDGELYGFYVGEHRPDVELIEELSGFFPRYLIPLRYEHLLQFPLNSNRKTDRPVLTARAAARRAGQLPTAVG